MHKCTQLPSQLHILSHQQQIVITKRPCVQLNAPAWSNSALNASVSSRMENVALIGSDGPLSNLQWKNLTIPKAPQNGPGVFHPRDRLHRARPSAMRLRAISKKKIFSSPLLLVLMLFLHFGYSLTYSFHFYISPFT